MYGARISVIVATSAMALGIGIGVVLAIAAGYVSGPLGSFIMRLTDAMLTIPGILVALMFVVAFGPGLKNIIVVIGLLQWPGFTRLLYSEVLTIRGRDYVMLARVAGADPFWIMARHIFPNIVNTVIVLATLDLGTVILFEAALSFLGLGIPPPTPAWGLMTAEGRQYLVTAWWIATLPGMAIAYTVLAVNLLGDWLRDALDPLRRQV
jgi:peptide/nickel transport system permease protein